MQNISSTASDKSAHFAGFAFGVSQAGPAAMCSILTVVQSAALHGSVLLLSAPATNVVPVWLHPVLCF